MTPQVWRDGGLIPVITASDDEPDRVDCGRCYGNGCSDCGMKGTVETTAGRERREEWEDGAYDRARDARIMGEDR